MPPPRFFAATELRLFFTAMDAHLKMPVTITVIGGSAIALYGVSSGTADIDTWQTDIAALQPVIAQARATTGLDIPVVPAAVADAPWYFEDRLQRESGPWSRLSVFKLEPHDLALSKALRGNEHDLAGIQALHQIVPLERDTLITRYFDEMGHVIGNEGQRDVRFTLMIERLYGEIEAERVEKRLELHRKKKH